MIDENGPAVSGDLPQKILWADDQPEVVQALLHNFGETIETVIIALDATDALSKLSSDIFDLVVVDLQMPPGEWGGLEFLRQAGRLAETLPIIVVSGAGTLKECAQAIRLGARDYVQKEEVATQLGTTIRRVMAKAKTEQPLHDYARARRLERRIHAFVIGEAKRLAAARGELDIFLSVVPREIATSTYQRRLDFKGKVAQELLLDLLDLQKMILSLWKEIPAFATLEKIVRPKRTEERTQWLVDLNEARKIIAHPMRGELSQDHRAALSRAETIVDAWLATRPTTPSEERST